MRDRTMIILMSCGIILAGLIPTVSVAVYRNYEYTINRQNNDAYKFKSTGEKLDQQFKVLNDAISAGATDEVFIEAKQNVRSALLDHLHSTSLIDFYDKDDLADYRSTLVVLDTAVKSNGNNPVSAMIYAQIHLDSISRRFDLIKYKKYKK